MKKLTIIGLLSLGGLGLLAAPSQAFFLKWLKWHKYSTTIRVQQYNAFTPVCFGTLRCIGCNPLSCAPPPVNPWHRPGGYGPGMGYAPPSCCTYGGCHGHSLPAATAHYPPKTDKKDSSQPLPKLDDKSFTPPQPTPLGSQHQRQMPAYPVMAYPMPVQPIGYQYPYGYYPNYHPGYYHGYRQPVYNPRMMPAGYGVPQYPQRAPYRW